MQQQVRPSLRCTLRRTRLICWKTWIRFYIIQVWARTTRGPSPSRSEGQRWAQKASLATHAPPPPAARVRERRGSERACNHRKFHLTEVRWKFPAKLRQKNKKKGEFPLILRNEFSGVTYALRSVWVPSHSEEWVLRSSELCDKSLSLLVELALLPSL